MTRTAILAFLLTGCSDAEAPALCPIGAEGPVRFQRFEGTVTRWQSISCIPVFVDPALAAFDADIDAALDAWSAFECSDLCFGRVTGPLSIGIEIRSSPSPASGEVSLEFSVRSAVVQHSVILANTAHADFTPRLFSHWLGVALGLSTSPGIESMLDIGRAREGTVTTPTALDEQAICALYRRTCE
jgi:hypothetical protein